MMISAIFRTNYTCTYTEGCSASRRCYFVSLHFGDALSHFVQAFRTRFSKSEFLSTSCQWEMIPGGQQTLIKPRPNLLCAYTKAGVFVLFRMSTPKVLRPSKRSLDTLTISANVSTLCLLPATAGTGPRLAPHALSLCKLPHVHMLRMVQALTPIFHHLPVPCTYTQRQCLRWIVTATLHPVGGENFKMLTCSPQEQSDPQRPCWGTSRMCSCWGAEHEFTSTISFAWYVFLAAMLPCLSRFFPFPFLPSISHTSSLAPCFPPCSVLQMAARQRFVWGENRFEWRMETKEGTKRQ